MSDIVIVTEESPEEKSEESPEEKKEEIKKEVLETPILPVVEAVELALERQEEKKKVEVVMQEVSDTGERISQLEFTVMDLNYKLDKLIEILTPKDKDDGMLDEDKPIVIDEKKEEKMEEKKEEANEPEKKKENDPKKKRFWV